MRVKGDVPCLMGSYYQNNILMSTYSFYEYIRKMNTFLSHEVAREARNPVRICKIDAELFNVPGFRREKFGAFVVCVHKAAPAGRTRRRRSA